MTSKKSNFRTVLSFSVAKHCFTSFSKLGRFQTTRSLFANSSYHTNVHSKMTSTSVLLLAIAFVAVAIKARLSNASTGRDSTTISGVLGHSVVLPFGGNTSTIPLPKLVRWQQSSSSIVFQGAPNKSEENWDKRYQILSNGDLAIHLAQLDDAGVFCILPDVASALTIANCTGSIFSVNLVVNGCNTSDVSLCRSGSCVNVADEFYPWIRCDDCDMKHHGTFCEEDFDDIRELRIVAPLIAAILLVILLAFGYVWLKFKIWRRDQARGTPPWMLEVDGLRRGNDQNQNG